MSPMGEFSVNRPNSRCDQLQQMIVGVAEIDALSAARPIGLAFDRNIVLTKPFFPSRQLRSCDGKGHMNWAATVMRGNSPARQMERFKRRTAPKQQKHTAATYIESKKPRITCQRRESKHLLVKYTRPVEVIHIKRSLENSGQFRQGRFTTY
jgi:hypothetical protein